MKKLFKSIFAGIATAALFVLLPFLILGLAINAVALFIRVMDIVIFGGLDSGQSFGQSMTGGLLGFLPIILIVWIFFGILVGLANMLKKNEKNEQIARK